MEENLNYSGKENMETPKQKKGNTSNRGFASMSREKQREIASKGGRAAHEQGVAHQWNADEARKAGRKGGESISQNREHMAEIGRRGGQASRGGGRKPSSGSADMQESTDASRDENIGYTGSGREMNERDETA